MKSTGIIRNIDELGRIVIPKPLRKKMNINDYDPIEIYVEDDKIILTKYSSVCLFCGSNTDLATFKDKKMCSACIESIKAIDSEKGE